ncbi:MAG: ABC transporter substrate-binding protein [Ruminococcaceae bacterium]|nr:ABC transporter substrate-binding protein [Oscillospiraceae bacterium]
MKFSKRIACALLACLFLISCLASCNGGNGGGEEETTEYTDIISIDSEENPQIPSKDYGEYDFTFIHQEGLAYNIEYLMSDGESEDVMLSAIYKRNTAVEDKYNINIAEYKVTDVVGEVRSQIMAGMPEFDVILASCKNQATLAREGLLYNLLDVEWFDMTKSYWDKNAATELKFGDKLFFTNCDLNAMEIAFLLYFNKQLIEDYQLTSPYEYIANNEWTLDNFGKLMKAVSRDMDNSGTFTELDQYGSIYEHDNARLLMYGCGIRTTTNDATGYPTLTLMSDKTVDVYEKIKDIYSDPNTYFCATCATGLDPHGFTHRWNYLRYLFTQDLYLFHFQADGALDQFADMEHEFGMVPVPKYDSAQERYYSTYPYLDNLFALPSIIEDVDRTGRIVEDMNYYSSIITIPTWFETILQRKYTRDDESEECIKIIKDSRTYDIGLYFDFGGVRSKILDVDITKGNISTNYAKLKKAIEVDIQDTWEKFQASNG